MRPHPKKFHFIGIGGAGMSGLAEILISMGHRVSGSDREASEVTDYLEHKGAQITIGHKAENVNQVDFLVYSSAISQDNPEMIRAQEQKIPQIRRAEMLGQLFNRKFGIAVAGTHGKTSTTSMLGSILLKAGKDPSIIVGGKLQNLMTNARLGKSDYLIAEADEYDRSFLTLSPRIAVITSLEADHLDIYSDLSDLKETFVKFANQTSFDGIVVLNADDVNLAQIAPEIEQSVSTFGLKYNADLMARNLSFRDGKSHCEVMANGHLLGSITLNLPGNHNIQNALAATAVALELGIPFETIAAGLLSFKGVGRRFEIVGREKDILIVDDYAHHPTEVAAVIQAARSGWDRRVVAVFQPHLFSRTRDFYSDFARSLEAADLAVVTDIYPAREEAIPGVSGALIADALQNEHLYTADKNELSEILSKQVRSGDLVLFLGAGDIWKYSRELLKKLQEQ